VARRAAGSAAVYRPDGLNLARPGMAARRSRTGRLLALGLLCLLLMPGTWWRETNHGPDGRNILSHRELDVPQPPDWPASLRLVGMWELESPNTEFGGYSALLMLPGRRLVAYSDRGGVLTFTPPGEGQEKPEIGSIPVSKEVAWNVDFESATRDPVSGLRWIGIESANVIVRLSAKGEPQAVRQPPEMEPWPKNSGAEAMVRLADGRFIVLGERESLSSLVAGQGLLFPGDPVDGAEAIRFRFVPPQGFLPTDMALLPDGRALILLRGLGFGLPPFSAKLVVADPSRIRAGEEWPWTPFADLSPPLPRDNYEGLAIAPAPGGGADIWIISDDNQASFQRTLLIRLHWDGERA